ncbi:MAG: hypothetical protein ACI8X5_002072 [Planctomycetota bacterium]|jgi:hypothetical protein
MSHSNPAHVNRPPALFQELHAARRGLSRRELLFGGAQGFGALALSGLLADRSFGASASTAQSLADLHHPAKAKSVIFLYMDGGPSQVDTFDPKPRLDRENGQPIGMKIPKTQFDDVGNVLRSPWKFKNYGESGLPVSELFPHVGSCADDLCLVRSMTSKFSEHTFANYFLHTGHGLQGRPSMGAWVTYGLGTETQNLPGYVVLNGGLTPPGGSDNFGSGFLPAAFQGSIFRAGANPVANAQALEASPKLQRAKLDLLKRLESQSDLNQDRQVEAAILNYELAFRMQAAIPELTDLSGESKATKALYGFDTEFKHTQSYARQCLLARRMVERGVRFIELTCPAAGGDRWDQHDTLKAGHENNARAVDQPIAGLLKDLKSRGLLESTLVLWAGEFGRTPMAQGVDGRDHNPHGFTIWMAGGGVRAGTVYGATDDYGYYAVDGKMTMYDLHATILHLLGVDHERLTVRFSGRDMRLTDVHGEVVRELLA